MGFMLAQVRLIRETRLPEDDVVNTFHFLTPTAGVTAADVDNVRDRLRTFYNGPSNWQNFLSPNLLGGLDAHRIRFYDIAGPAPHPPLREEPLTITLRAVSGLPAEVALCLSYSAAPTAGVPAGRSRGRIYLGPLNVDAIETFFGDSRPDSTLETALLNAGSALMGADPLTAPRWSVFSTRNLAMYPIARVCVDNSFDTQRRRGAAPTNRRCLPSSEV